MGENDVKNLQLDCTLAASYLMMSATSKGLGTCWINFAKEITDSDLLLETGIPENHTIVAPIIIGYPEVVPSIPKRKEAQILKAIQKEIKNEKSIGSRSNRIPGPLSC